MPPISGRQTVRLARNYRSSATIVSAAARIAGTDAPAEAMRPMLEPILVHAAANEHAEAEFVAATIEEPVGGRDLLTANSGRPADRRKAERQLGFADFAVLYRTDGQAGALREAFDRAGIPFGKSSPAPIAANAAVQAILAALGKQDSGLLDGSLPLCLDAAVEQVRQPAGAPDAARLAEARRWLTALAAPLDDDEERLREQVALATEADFHDLRADRVSLLTVHAAKGLEFAVVFIVGCEAVLAPFFWGGAGSGDASGEEEEKSIAEERRLFYVAATRAKDRLVIRVPRRAPGADSSVRGRRRGSSRTSRRS